MGRSNKADVFDTPVVLAPVSPARATSRIDVSGGTTLFGTTSGEASSAWSFITDSLLDGADSFTTTCAAASNKGVLSSALSAAVDAPRSTASPICTSHTVGGDRQIILGAVQPNIIFPVFDSAPSEAPVANSASTTSLIGATSLSGANNFSVATAEPADKVWPRWLVQ